MKTNLDKLYKTNSSLENDGVDFEISPGVAFVIGRYHAKSKTLREAMAKETKPYTKQLQNNTISEEKAFEISVKAFVSGCVRGWKGIVINGEEVPYSEQACVELLMGLPDLFETLQEYASNRKHYLEDLGNS